MITNYKYYPKTKSELVEAIKKEIYEVQGTPDNPNWNADLNCINTSGIEDMSLLFSNNGFLVEFPLGDFNGDISKWNVSNVKDMRHMFAESKFNGDISKWNVNNVKDMMCMFYNSKFNGDISKWDVSNVEDMSWMFENSKFNGDIGNWDVSDKMKMSTGLNNISANLDSDKLPDKVISRVTADRILQKYPEIGMVRKDIRRFMNKEKIKELTDIYGQLEIDNKTMVKFMNILTLKIPYEEKIIMCYKEAKNDEERMKAIGFTVIVPYIKEREEQRKNNRNKSDINNKEISH